LLLVTSVISSPLLPNAIGRRDRLPHRGLQGTDVILLTLELAGSGGGLAGRRVQRDLRGVVGLDGLVGLHLQRVQLRRDFGERRRRLGARRQRQDTERGGRDGGEYEQQAHGTCVGTGRHGGGTPLPLTAYQVS